MPGKEFIRAEREIREAVDAAAKKASSSKMSSSYWKTVGKYTATGAGVGGSAGLAGGPFAPITVPVGTAGGFLLGLGVGTFKWLFTERGAHKKAEKLAEQQTDRIFEFANKKVDTQRDLYANKRDILRTQTGAQIDALKQAGKVRSASRQNLLSDLRDKRSQVNLDIQNTRKQRVLSFKEYSDRTEYLNSTYYAKAKVLQEKSIINSAYIDAATENYATSQLILGKKADAVGQGYAASLVATKDSTKSDTSQVNRLIANSLKLSAEVYNAASQIEQNKIAATNQYNAKLLQARSTDVNIKGQQTLNRLTSSAGLKQAERKLDRLTLSYDNMIAKSILASQSIGRKITNTQELMKLENAYNFSRIRSMNKILSSQISGSKLTENLEVEAVLHKLRSLEGSKLAEAINNSGGFGHFIDQGVNSFTGKKGLFSAFLKELEINEAINKTQELNEFVNMQKYNLEVEQGKHNIYKGSPIDIGEFRYNV